MWSRDTHAARSSSPWREAGGRVRPQLPGRLQANVLTQEDGDALSARPVDQLL
jgi:hypothetical protein